MLRRLLAPLLFLFALALPAQAQVFVVANCGTVTGIDLAAGRAGQLFIDTNGNLCAGGAVSLAPSAATTAGITPVVSASAEASHVLKASPGNLYSVYATNLTATSGFLTVLNATSAPADGAITPLACVPFPANGFAGMNFNPGPPSVYSTGITAVITSATTCFTKTTGVITGFISGSVK